MPHRIAHRRSGRSSRHGFTLVELIFVLAIMAMLAGIAVPRYARASARYAVEAAAKRVAADLETARARARAASAPCVVTFTSGAPTYTITNPTLGGAAGSTTRHTLAAPPYRSTVQGVAFPSGTSVSFDGYGVPSQAGTVTVACGTEQRQITIAAKTGTVTVN